MSRCGLGGMAGCPLGRRSVASPSVLYARRHFTPKEKEAPVVHQYLPRHRVSKLFGAGSKPIPPSRPPRGSERIWGARILGQSRIWRPIERLIAGYTERPKTIPALQLIFTYPDKAAAALLAVKDGYNPVAAHLILLTPERDRSLPRFPRDS